MTVFSPIHVQGGYFKCHGTVILVRIDDIPESVQHPYFEFFEVDWAEIVTSFKDEVSPIIIDDGVHIRTNNKPRDDVLS